MAVQLSLSSVPAQVLVMMVMIWVSSVDCFWWFKYDLPTTTTTTTTHPPREMGQYNICVGTADTGTFADVEFLFLENGTWRQLVDYNDPWDYLPRTLSCFQETYLVYTKAELRGQRMYLRQDRLAKLSDLEWTVTNVTLTVQGQLHLYCPQNGTTVNVRKKAIPFLYSLSLCARKGILENP